MDWPYLVAAVWWGLLGLSVLLTLLAIWVESWRMLVLAACCSLLFCVAAAASFGIFLIPIPLIQLAVAWLVYRNDARYRHWQK